MVKAERAPAVAGSRRIFAPHFKLQVLDSYRCDADCKGNQRATARKYGIHRRQIQKWLQAEAALRNSVGGKLKTPAQVPQPQQPPPPPPPPSPPAPIDLSVRRARSPPAAWDLRVVRRPKLFKPYLDAEEERPRPQQQPQAGCCPCCDGCYAGDAEFYAPYYYPTAVAYYRGPDIKLGYYGQQQQQQQAEARHVHAVR